MLYPLTLTRNSPFALIQSMLRDLDRVAASVAAPGVFPAMNIWQGTDALAITAEIPGVEPADLDVSVKDNVLTITGERKAPELPRDVSWHRSERSYGKFSRAIRLPFATTNDKIEARLNNGVLRIVVARPDDDKPRKIEIKSA